MRGKIIRGVGGFYYVHTAPLGVIECRAKGLFRKQKIKPLVGDNAAVEILDEEKRIGNITEIETRANSLVRPAVANVDQAVVIFALSYPKPNLNLLDRFLLSMKHYDIPAVICFNKTDDLEEERIRLFMENYKKSGYSVFLTSTVTGSGIEEFYRCLSGKTSVLAGPSGVGKSSLMRVMFPDVNVEIGEISNKIKRGKHTTRHSELFFLGEETYVMDTPGFTALELPQMEKEQLKDFYEEFVPYKGCRFLGCVHINEPDCRVKEAVGAGEIAEERYMNYKLFYEEIRGRKSEKNYYRK